MKNITFVFILCLSFVIAWAPASHAGQVVTQQERIWAQQVLNREYTYDFVFSPDTIAVLYFKNNTGEKRFDLLQKGLPCMLSSDLSQLQGLRPVERVKIQALMEEMDFGISGLVDASTAPRIGRLLGARYVIRGDIHYSAVAEISIKATLIDGEKERIVGQPTAEGFLSSIVTIEKQLLFDIIELLNIKLSAEKRKRLEKPLTTSEEALFNLCRAIDSSDRRDYIRAETYYTNALKEDPNLGPAQEGLKELQRLSLINQRKKSQSLLKALEARTSKTDSLVEDYSTRQARTPGDLEKRQSQAGSIDFEW